MNSCFNLNVLMLSLEHVLPYKFFPLYNSEIHYNQTIINIFKYKCHKILCTKTYYMYSKYNQYITVYYSILQYIVASWPADGQHKSCMKKCLEFKINVVGCTTFSGQPTCQPGP